MTPSFRGKYIPSNTEDDNQNNTVRGQITVIENASALIQTLLKSISVCPNKATHFKDIENYMEGGRILEVAKKFLEGELKNE